MNHRACGESYRADRDRAVILAQNDDSGIFCAAILERTLPVYLMDERMTTMAASRYLNETDTRGAKRKQVIDTLSAEIILQNALDKLKYMQA